MTGPTLPSRNMIECFDISNLQGKDAVASMVTFKDGIPDKTNYRRFKIKGYDEPNDPGMIHEVVARRIQYLVNEELDLPDLMIIDGGKGQLSRAIEAAENFDAEVKIISLAKKLEEIFFDVKKKPLILDNNSPALYIIQNLRDEAHRFAITYHRTLRDKKTTASELDNIEGIGNNIKSILLKYFKSVETIKKADIDSLKDVDGIGGKTAEKIYNYFNR